MHDLFGGGFVLVRFGSPEINVESLIEAASERGVPLDIADIDHADAAAIYQRALVLVRPDGHVAWRADALPPERARSVFRSAETRPLPRTVISCRSCQNEGGGADLSSKVSLLRSRLHKLGGFPWLLPGP